MPAYDPAEYEPVEDRIRKFWADHPNGQIHTDLLEHDEKRFIVKSTVYRDRDESGRVNVLAMGLAEEVITPGHPVNRNYALENCETSAIGRALANAGYATKGKRPSREEMQKVQRVQERVTPAAEARDALRELVQNMNLDGRAVADEYMKKYGENLADSEAANQIRDFTFFVRKREERDADR